jgi:hypothetical protein
MAKAGCDGGKERVALRPSVQPGRSGFLLGCFYAGSLILRGESFTISGRFCTASRFVDPLKVNDVFIVLTVLASVD